MRFLKVLQHRWRSYLNRSYEALQRRKGFQRFKRRFITPQNWTVHSKWMLGTFVFSIAINSFYGILLNRYTNARTKFVFSKPLTVYSVTVASFFAVYYVKKFYEDLENGQLTLRDTTKIYCYMNVAVCLLNYVTQWEMTKRISRWQNSIPIFTTINYFNIELKIVLKALRLAIVKMAVFPMVVHICLVFQEKFRPKSEIASLSTREIMIPLMIANQLNNCFFGGIVVVQPLLGALNKRLSKVLQEVNTLQTPLQMELQKPYYRMRRFCELADYMDELARKYTILTTYSMAYLQLTALSLICSMLVNFVIFILGFFNQYQAIAEHFINEEPYDVFHALTNLVFLVVPFLEIALVAKVSSTVLDETRKTGNLLQRIELQHADHRFVQVVHTFWLQVRTTKYKLLPLGLLELNVNLINKMFSSVTGFLLIFIQSDLTLKFSLK